MIEAAGPVIVDARSRIASVPSVCGQVAVALILFFASAAMAAPDGVRNALDATRLGLYDAADFRLADGACTDCPTIPQALWYFRNEVIAVPRTAEAGFARERTAQDDVREWAKSHLDGDGSRPPLLWLGSPQIAEGVRLSDDGQMLLAADGKRLAFSVTKKIDSNLSYFDELAWQKADKSAFAGDKKKEQAVKYAPPYKFVPHVIEPSAGADRATLAFLCAAYCEDKVPDENGKMSERTVLKYYARTIEHLLVTTGRTH